MTKVWVALAFMCGDGYHCEQIAHLVVPDRETCQEKQKIVKFLADEDGIENYLLVCTMLEDERLEEA